MSSSGPDYTLSSVPAEALLADANAVDLGTKIIEDVMETAKNSSVAEEEAIGEDIMERLKHLWISKLEDLRKQKPELNLEAELSAIAGEQEESDSADEDEEEVTPEFMLAAAASAAAVDPVPGPSSSGARPKKAVKSRPVKKKPKLALSQVDGPADDSSDDDDDNDDNNDDDDDDDADDDDDDDDDLGEDEEDDAGEDEDPLGSGDDISEEDPADLFDTENVVVCQYDKITRARNKWKFHLKDGIMNLNGKDYVFQRATGDAEW